MKPKQKYKIFQAGLQLWLVCALAAPLSAHAALLDSIDIKRADGVAVIKITLSRNVRYRRHFPLDRANIVNIYFDDVALESTGRPLPQHPSLSTPDTVSRDPQREEYLRSPPSDLVPYFWVEYLRNEAGDSGFEPYYIAVQFSQTVNFSLRVDEDNRAFYIYVPITQRQNPTKGSATPAPVKEGGVQAAPNPPVELSPAPSVPPASHPATGSPP